MKNGCDQPFFMCQTAAVAFVKSASPALVMQFGCMQALWTED
jgi:hypothetical protein